MATAPARDGTPVWRHPWLRWAWVVVWAGVTVPVVSAGLTRGAAAGAAGAGCAVVAYASLTIAWFRSFDMVSRGERLPDRLSGWSLVAGAAATAGAVAALGAPGLQMVVFLAVATAFALPWQISVWVIMPLGAALLLIAHALPSWREAGEMALPLLGAGTACLLARHIAERRWATRLLEQRNHELEINDERNRMARDLHDILGHSLTVIALKTELAGRLVDSAPQAAKQELDEVQSMARAALADVRATVNSYRRLSLPGELARAADVLASAGVRADLPTAVDAAAPELRELFAWVVREGVTNVVRHARATRCRVSLEPGAIEVADDGVGICGPTDGHGLDGLRQRCAAGGAELAVGPGPAGTGTLLRVSVRPLPSSAAAAAALPRPGLEEPTAESAESADSPTRREA